MYEDRVDSELICPAQVPGGKLGDAKAEAGKACVDTLYTYRTKCATASSSGQLVLPESLKLIALYTLALAKCTALRSVPLKMGLLGC